MTNQATTIKPFQVMIWGEGDDEGEPVVACVTCTNKEDFYMNPRGLESPYVIAHEYQTGDIIAEFTRMSDEPQLFCHYCDEQVVGPTDRFTVNLKLDIDTYYLVINGLRDHGCTSCGEVANALQVNRKENN
jgi:hypothetical protein